jgi:HK97 family phage major capsid protein
MNTTVVNPKTIERDGLLQRAHALLNKPDFSREDSSRVESLLALADALEPRMGDLRRAKVLLAEKELGIRNELVAALPDTESSFRDFLRHGKSAVSDKQRALAEGVDASGGYLAPQSFQDAVLANLKAYDELFEVCTVVRTSGGANFVYPLDDDSAQVATVVAENAISVTTADAVFDRITFGKCPTWRSGHLRAPLELVADAATDFAMLLAARFGRRFARGFGASCITTLLGAATSGKTTASPTAVTPDECLDLIASVDAGYAQRGSFLMNLATYIAIIKTKGTTGGSYLVAAQVDADGRPTLFGRRVYLSPSMPNIATTAKPVAFGDLGRFLRREVLNSLSVKSYFERYADFGQLAYEGFWRVDAALAKPAAGPTPVRFVTCA